MVKVHGLRLAVMTHLIPRYIHFQCLFRDTDVSVVVIPFHGVVVEMAYDCKDLKLIVNPEPTYRENLISDQKCNFTYDQDIIDYIKKTLSEKIDWPQLISSLNKDFKGVWATSNQMGQNIYLDIFGEIDLSKANWNK